MRKLAVLTVATVVTLGTMGTAVGSAGASVPAASKFCNAVKNIDTNEIGSPTTAEDAATTAQQLKKVQKAAKGNTKKAIGTIVDAYEAVADGASARKSFATIDVLTALGTFGLAVGKCFLPDITTPSLG